MLTFLIELLLRTTINVAAGTFQAEEAKGRLRWWQRLLSRLSRRAAPLATSSSADMTTEEVVIGESVPSALDLLRGGRNAGASDIALTLEELKRHLWLLGSTGVGKTVAILRLCCFDIVRGRDAVAQLDARGDAFDSLLRWLAGRFAPEQLAGRLYLIDFREHAPYRKAGAEEYIVGVNPLELLGLDPYSRALFVLDVLRQEWGEALGVQIQQTLLHCLVALAESGWTLLEIELLLTAAAFRSEVLKGVSDPATLRFWQRFEEMNEQARSQWVTPVLNKMAWLSHPRLKLMLGQRGSKLRFRDIFDENPDAIVLICLAADELFKSTAGAMGNILAAATIKAVMRSDRPLGSRKTGVHLYCDEWQNIASSSGEMFAEAISEGRRFGLSLCLSNQTLSGQLDPKMKSLVRNVVGTTLVYAVGPADADAIAAEWPGDEPKPLVRQKLASQQVGECMVLRRGKPPVQVRTRFEPVAEVSEEKVAELRQACLERWGRQRREVEAELAAREEKYGTTVAGVSPGASGTTSPPPGCSDGAPMVSAAIEVREVDPPAKPRRKRKGAGA
jgi:hypothetical protein